MRYGLGTYYCILDGQNDACAPNALTVMISALDQTSPILSLCCAPSFEDPDSTDPFTFILESMELFRPYDQCSAMEHRIIDKIWPLINEGPTFGVLVAVLNRFLVERSQPRLPSHRVRVPSD
ncbi:MAG: hypothetical protein M1294_09890 [Firmicutes bacterium]|nr:hypothetical protein [Bacillota bacterium]